MRSMKYLRILTITAGVIGFLMLADGLFRGQRSDLTIPGAILLAAALLAEARQLPPT
jgi:hypothetical protein